MKNIFKRIIVFSVALLLSISNANGIEMIYALKEVSIPQNKENIELYNVRTEEQVIANESIIMFYNVDPNKEEFLEYKKEQERLEQERLARIEYKTQIVNFAKRFIGNPYVSGGTSLTNGADCSGFVQSVFRNYGISLPRTAPAQATVGIEVSIENIEIGDIVSYGYNGYITHSALYIGNGKIVHASTPELGIRIDNINILPIVTIRRVI